MKSFIVAGAAVGLLAATSVSPSQAGTTEACPCSAAELTAALGFTVQGGQGSELPFPGGKMMTCEYKGNSKVGLSLSQNRSTSPADAKNVAMGFQGQAIAGDPDGAIWVAVVGNTSRISLSYVRGSTHTEISLVGVNSKNETEAAPLRNKLQKLRRVP